VHRIAIELTNPGETDMIMKDRAERRSWLEDRDYRVVDIAAADVERDLATELDRLASLLPAPA
jgi:tRNA/rRNA methyltransferase